MVLFNPDDLARDMQHGGRFLFEMALEADAAIARLFANVR